MAKNKTFGSLGEVATIYSKELGLYYKVLSVSQLISLNQHGIHTDGRGIRSVKIFTRQTLCAISLAKLLPRPHGFSQLDEDLWDISSIASLTRNLIEGYLSLYYFGIEKVTPNEAELRFLILQLHRNVEWYNIRKNEMKEDELKQFEDGIADERIRIKNHSYLPNLSEQQRKRAIQGSEMYKSKSDFEQELPICVNLRKEYRLLSNLAHVLPLSIERIDNVRGRGIGCEVDVAYCLQCLTLARKYLTAITVGIANHFPDQLLEKFKDEVQSIQ